MNDGILFEQRCIEKLKQLGFNKVQATPITDYGADIVAYYNGAKYIFQCKYWKHKQGVSAVQEVLAAKQFYQADRCAVISHAGYTDQAYKLAKPNFILLINEEVLFQANDIGSLFVDELTNMQSVKPITHNYDVIKEFELIKHRLGYVPTLSELDKTLRYKINKQYHNYSSFLSSIGERLKNSRPTEDQLKDEYLRIRKLLGRTPRATDIKNNSTIPYNSFHQYPLTKLQKECGDTPLCDRSVTKEELIEEYLNLKQQLGHFPTGTEIDKFGKYKTHQYRSKFGSLEQFFNLPQINMPQRHFLTIPEIEIIFTLLTLCLELKSEDISYQVLQDISKGSKKILTTNQIEYKFGNYSKFIERLVSNDKLLILKEQIKEMIQHYIQNA